MAEPAQRPPAERPTTRFRPVPPPRRVPLALSLRRFAWWLLSPAAYANAAIAARTGRRVLLGPFAGMRYPFSLVARLRFDGALQVGSYECEVHEAVEGLIAANPGVVVNVGAAGGYYCCGLAMRLPESRVIAYETVAENRAGSIRLASENAVQGRIEMRGTCTLEEFAALDTELGAARVAVVMDCEGLEAELVDTGRVGWLRAASLLVELHPSVDPEMAATLSRRLADTHEVELIDSRERWASSFPELWEMSRLRNVDRELLVAEHRHGHQQWLWARPVAEGRLGLAAVAPAV